MGIACGSQVVLCEYPIRLDTYRGCSHGCRYCFAQSKTDISVIRPDNCVEALRRFIAGKRTTETNWCDWAIPLHWGGLSDPFQPAERELGISLKALEVFAETGYPFIVSTKGRLVAEEPYLSLLRKCNAVVQISMVCSSYDRMEPGAPTFEERLEMVRKLSGNVRRVIVRAQPYITNVRDEFIGNLPRMAEAGAWGVTLEGMKFKEGKPGLMKVRGDYCYPEETLRMHYERIKRECGRVGLHFFCAENRLRHIGESTACCGCGGLNGFEGNRHNVVSDPDGAIGPTERMMQPGTATCFKALHQDAGSSRTLLKKSFADQMRIEAEDFYKESKAHTEEEVFAFTRWLRSTGVKASELNELTGTQMGSHWLCVTPGGQAAVPTAEMFDRLRHSPKLSDVPGYILAIVY